MSQKTQIDTDPELREFLPQYLANRKRDLKNLLEALGKRDLKFIQATSHKIRGHATSYGFLPLTKLCTQIEKAAGEDNGEAIAALLREYAEYIESIEL